MYLSEEISAAIEKFLNGSASPEDIKTVNAWYYSFNDEEIIISSDVADLRQKVKDRMKMRLYQALPDLNQYSTKSKSIRRYWIAAAAVTIIATGVGIFKLNSTSVQHNPVTHIQQAPVLKDVSAPAAAIATLTLANGRAITLNSSLNGMVALEGGVQVIKQADGELVYSSSAAEKNNLYNTIAVAKGSKIVTLKMADGTQVWLNAESSLRYPVAYVEGEEKVFVTGEAYFEVSKNVNRRFIVCAGNTTTEVLGTHFTINAYEEKDFVTVTLLEGRLKVKSTAMEGIVIPGQQAKVPVNGRFKISDQVDLEEVMAWKNGLFKFNREDLQSIMKKIERWYNVEISYTGEIKKLTFGGIVPSTENVSSVLDLLQMTGVVRFTIEPSLNGKEGRIIVRCT